MFGDLSFLEFTLRHQRGSKPLRCELNNGTTLELWETGILRVVPKGDSGSHRVLISSGIHGNETAPMEICDQLVNEILSGELLPRNQLLFVIGNPTSANIAQRFVDENLNRLFSQDASTSSGLGLEHGRAAQLKLFTDKFFAQGSESRLHYDLHTAIRGSQLEKFAVYPFLHDRQWSNSQIGFLERCGMQAILLSNKPSTTYSYYTSTEYEADAFTVELGSVKPFGQNDMSKFKGILAGLRRLVSDQEQFIDHAHDIQIFEVVEEVIKLSEELRLHFPDDAKNFTEFPAGTLLASDKDYEYWTKRDGERFVFPITNVPVGQRAMLVVAPIELKAHQHDSAQA